jgi:sec-independent protein translocase protein TatC
MRFLPFLGPKRRVSDPDEFRASLVEHLEELRIRIFRIVILLVIGWVIGWFAEPWIYDQLNSLVKPHLAKLPDYKEPFRSFTDPFMLKLKLSFFIGLIVVLPFCVLQVWGFVEPGLKENERRPLQIVAPLSVLLFVIGAGFCWLILPSAFIWFMSYVEDFPGTVLYPEPGTMVFFILKMLLAFGLGFQLPLLVYFLAKIGLLSQDALKTYWRQATVFIFFGAAIITPSNDIFSMLMMAVPLTLLFFISMWAVQISAKKRERQEAAALAANDDDALSA